MQFVREMAGFHGQVGHLYKHDGADGNRAAEHIEKETYSYFNSFQ